MKEMSQIICKVNIHVKRNGLNHGFFKDENIHMAALNVRPTAQAVVIHRIAQYVSRIIC